jgi:hypothetical protein
MIASFRHGFIFIKSKKTAGSSVEHVLAPLCGPDDVVTPAGFDEPVLPGGQARNFTRDPEVVALYGQGLAHRSDPGHALFLEIDRRCREASDFHTHMTAEEAQAALDRDFWRQALKFSIERHPYEKAVSQAWFSWARNPDQDQDFASFLDQVVRHGPYANARFYMIDGQPALDRVLRYERLEEELGQLTAQLGLRLPDPLPRIKGGLRADPRPAHEVLSDAQKQVIYRRCRAEFDYMGYQP